MNTTQENIQKKEDSLAALMKKVLDAPLRPLNESLNNIKNELNSVQEEIIEKISNQIGASVDDIEKIKISVNNIKKTDFPALKSEIEQVTQHISAKTEQENQKLAISINEKSIQYKADLQSAFTELLSVIFEVLNQQKELKERLQTWTAELGATNQASKEQQSTTTQAITHAIFLNQELIKKNHTDLSNQIIESHTAINSDVSSITNCINKKIDEKIAIIHSTNQTLTSFKALSEESNQRLLDQFNANQYIISDLKNTLQSNNSTLIDILNKQNKNIEKEIFLNHKKMQKLIFFSVFFFAITLIHIGYDILNRFH